MATASIVTIGNELVSGDTVNTNGSWLAARLEALGVDVLLIASLPDEEERVAALVRAQAAEADVVLVTGGLGGTPDDITREAIAAAFGVPQEEQPEVAERLRARFRGDPDYVTRWAQLPAGSRPLENPLGGAPGFVIGSVYVLPGLPAEMEAMFETVAAELAGVARSAPGGAPIAPPRVASSRYLKPVASATPPSRSARTPASEPKAASSRSCSSRATLPLWQRHRPGSSRRWPI